MTFIVEPLIFFSSNLTSCLFFIMIFIEFSMFFHCAIPATFLFRSKFILANYSQVKITFLPLLQSFYKSHRTILLFAKQTILLSKAHQLIFFFFR
jgi:hypothetical protein